MTNYHLTITTKTLGKLIVLLRYSERGELAMVELREREQPMGHKELRWLYEHLPVTLDELQIFTARPWCKFQLIQSDLSFDAFWDLYGYKLGNKKRAQKLWDKLPDETRILAMKKVIEYNHYIATTGTKKVFAERWIAHERWHDEY